jgi:Kef-type K+ transport system membrane component KefB
MKASLLYVLLVVIPVIVVLKVLQAGEHLSGVVITAPAGSRGAPASLPEVALLIAQIAVIIGFSRLLGSWFRKLHQPQVIGEMIAGVMLGPSLLGWIFPRVSSALFPDASIGLLNGLSQVGLIFFMFLVGLQLDPKELRESRRTAIVTSHASIVFPFTLGVVLALYLYPRLGNQDTPFSHFALFVGTAMSITAFPVLARILSDANALKTRVGAIAIACAAVDDVTAWCILAALLLLVRSGRASFPLWAMLSGSAAYSALMLFGVRRWLVRIEAAYRVRGYVSQRMLAGVLVIVLASAEVTELLGIHALFGAFVLGAVMPKDMEFVRAVTGKMEDFIVVLLLPLFFAFTGLRTNIGLLSGVNMWAYAALIVSIAILGKFGGSTFSARLTGLSWRDASAIGILMNTRGLMELVVLNIGLDVGAITRTVFAMMVIMALVTTVMAAPLLAWLHPDWAAARNAPAGELTADAYAPTK